VREQTRRDAELSEADRIAADFSSIPFDNHEARTLALAYFRLKAERDALADALKRAAYIAEHLMQMIDQETWRATGSDDGQGHYEGDYHAEQVAEELRGLRALADSNRATRP
jgi:hypothetical protein